MVTSFLKLPVVSVPVSVLRQAVIVVALPFCEAGAVRVPVSLKPTSVLGHVVAWADFVLAILYVVPLSVNVVVGTALYRVLAPVAN